MKFNLLFATNFDMEQGGHDGPGVAHRIVWYNIKEQGFKSQPLGYRHGLLWYDLMSEFFYLTWPIFKNVQDFIEANTLSKFHEYQTENLVSRAYTWFF